MTVLVDTSVWSLALRRRSRSLSAEEELVRGELAELIREGRAQMIGPMRQEVLSGIRSRSQYERLRQDLRAFEDPGWALRTTKRRPLQAINAEPRA